MNTDTNRRNILKAVPVAFTALAVPAFAAGRSEGKTDLAGWERAKSAYRDAVERVARWLPVYSAHESAAVDDAKTAPTGAITYIDEGFTQGGLTLAPRKRTVELNRTNYRDRADDLGKHPDYVEYRRTIEAWESQPERIALRETFRKADQEWERLVSEQGAAWHAAVAFPLADLASIAEKIDVLRGEADGDAEWSATLFEALAADIARANRRV